MNGMNNYRNIRDTRSEVMTMSNAACMAKYNREREEYLRELDMEYNEWRDHFASMFD